MNVVRFQNPAFVTRHLVNDLFNNMLVNDNQACCNVVRPAANIFETEKEFRIELLVPGFSKEEIKLSFHKNVLTVQSERKAGESQEYLYTRREFGFDNFEKKFNIPETVNAENINASFRNGILEIVLPKKEEALEKTPLEIAVN